MPVVPAPPPLDASALLAAVLRELAGPVSGVEAMVDLLERQSLSSDAAACAETLRDATRRLADALADAGDLASPEALPLHSRAFSPRQLVDDLQSRWLEPGSAGATVLAGYEGDAELWAEGDAGRLSRIFDAMVSRARVRSRGAVEAVLSARAFDDRVRLSGRVRDDGRAEDDPGALFCAGQGGPLSLVLASRLVAEMGGQVDARANAGSGMTVAFEVDLRRAQQVQPPAPAEPVEVGPQLHVLIVDDNATNRLVAEAFCDMFGCTSDSAEDGLEALEAVAVRRYDVILMDVKMPRMDGVDATRAIRATQGPAAHTPIIALTANADPEDIRRYLAAGMAGVVEKPIKADRLAEVLNAVLESGEKAETGRRAA